MLRDEFDPITYKFEGPSLPKAIIVVDLSPLYRYKPSQLDDSYTTLYELLNMDMNLINSLEKGTFNNLEDSLMEYILRLLIHPNSKLSKSLENFTQDTILDVSEIELFIYKLSESIDIPLATTADEDTTRVLSKVFKDLQYEIRRRINPFVGNLQYIGDEGKDPFTVVAGPEVIRYFWVDDIEISLETGHIYGYFPVV